MAITLFERWSPEYALNNAFDDMRVDGVDGLKKHLTANALKVVNGFQSLSGRPEVSLFTTALLGGDAVNLLLDRLSECDWTIKEVMKGSETSKAVVGFDYHDMMVGTIEMNMIKEDGIWKIDGLGVDVDIVLNNAGLQIAYRTDYCATPAEDYEISFRVNTIAPALICYHFLPRMISRGTGRILNTTSGIALDVCQAGYSASKAALDKITIDLGSKVEGTDVLINLTDPGWCRTDLGGPQAPNAPESAIPGIVTGVFVNDGKSGRHLGAQHFAGMTLEDAVKKAEAEFDSPYGK